LVKRSRSAEEKAAFLAQVDPLVARLSRGGEELQDEIANLGLQYHGPLDDLDPELHLPFEEARYLPHAEIRNRFDAIVEELQERFWPGELPGDFPWDELPYTVGELLRMIERFGVWFDPLGSSRLPRDWWGKDRAADPRQGELPLR
jgi:hypothetical protein